MSKAFAFASVVLMMSAASFAQDRPQTPPSTQTPSQSPRTQPAEPAKTAQSSASSDQQFVKTVAGDNMAEVELGKLAAEKASRDDVKKFAQKMVDDHGKAGDELKTIASSKNITLPQSVDASHKAVHDRLSKLSGAAFDRDYVREMLNGHRKAVAAFKNEASNGKDAEIKAWASKTQPTIEAHLREVEELNRGAVGTTGQRPADTRQPTSSPSNPPTTSPSTPPSTARPPATTQPPSTQPPASRP